MLSLSQTQTEICGATIIDNSRSRCSSKFAFGRRMASTKLDRGGVDYRERGFGPANDRAWLGARALDTPLGSSRRVIILRRQRRDGIAWLSSSSQRL